MANDEQTAENADESRWGLKKIANLLSIPVGLFGGFMAAKTQIERDADKNFASQGWFDPARKQREIDITDKLKTKLKSATPAERHTALKVIEKDYRAAKVTAMEEQGIKGLGTKWGHLKGNERWNAVIIGATVTGIAIGAVYALTQDSQLTQLLSDKKDREIGA